MILKLIPLHHPDYKRTIEYVLKDGKGHNSIKPEAITHNLKGNTVDEWVKEYMQHEAQRNHPQKNQIYLYHDVISFHKADHQNITKEKLTDIAQEYIRQRGIEGIYVAAVHEDKANYHIHCATSGVELHTGKAHRLSHSDLKELKINLQNYHQKRFPEITHSTVAHGKGKEYVTDREYQARQRDERALSKDQIQQTVTTCFAKAHSQQEFLEMLHTAGLPHYERAGKPQGVMYEEMKFRFTRFNIDIKKLPQIHTEMKKEQQTIDEIRSIRAGWEDMLKESPTHDVSLTSLQLQDIHQELDRLYMEKDGLFLQMTLKGLSDERLSKELDIIIQRESYLLTKAEELSLSHEAEKLNIEKEPEPLPAVSAIPLEENPDFDTFTKILEEERDALIEAEQQEKEDVEEYPEWFEQDNMEDPEPSDSEEQNILDEFQDLREEVDERDMDELDRDMDDDDMDR